MTRDRLRLARGARRAPFLAALLACANFFGELVEPACWAGAMEALISAPSEASRRHFRQTRRRPTCPSRTRLGTSQSVRPWLSQRCLARLARPIGPPASPLAAAATMPTVAPLNRRRQIARRRLSSPVGLRQTTKRRRDSPASPSGGLAGGLHGPGPSSGGGSRESGFRLSPARFEALTTMTLEGLG
jgi:hypothetical protein